MEIDPGNAVAGGKNCSGLGDFDLFVVVLDLLADDVADFFGSDVHRSVLGALSVLDCDRNEDSQ